MFILVSCIDFLMTGRLFENSMRILGWGKIEIWGFFSIDQSTRVPDLVFSGRHAENVKKLAGRLSTVFNMAGLGVVSSSSGPGDQLDFQSVHRPMHFDGQDELKAVSTCKTEVMCFFDMDLLFLLALELSRSWKFWVVSYEYGAALLPTELVQRTLFRN